ncbi:MAG TPA: MFS transporter, partial [Chloroflexota bacterium]|nr:MFS transporter [Chloroflexota bacterium]
PFFLYSFVALIATILAILFVRESPHRQGKTPPPFHFRTVPRLMRQHYYAFSTAGLAQIFAQMIRAGRQLIVPLYAAYVIGLDVGAVGTIVSLSSAVDMSLFYPAGLVMDRLGRRFAAIPSFFIQAMGMALIPFTHSYLALLVAALMLGLGNGLGSGSMMTLGADLAPKNEPGEFLGIWRLIGDAGTTSGPIVVGTVADTLGLGAAAFSLCGIGLLAVLMFVVFVRETLQKPAVVSGSPGK